MELMFSSCGGPGLNDSFGDLVVVSPKSSVMISSKDPSNCNNLLLSKRLPSVSLNTVTFFGNESVNSTNWLENDSIEKPNNYDDFAFSIPNNFNTIYTLLHHNLQFYIQEYSCICKSIPVSSILNPSYFLTANIINQMWTLWSVPEYEDAVASENTIIPLLLLIIFYCYNQIIKLTSYFT